MGLIVNVQPTPAFEQVFWRTYLPAAGGTNEVHLFKNDLAPGPTTVIGDFTEADFTGYSSVPLASSDSSHLDPVLGVPVISSLTPLVFSQSGITIMNTVYGWWIDDGAGGSLAFAERFDTPILMDATGKQIALLIRLFFLGITGPSALED